MSTSGVSAVSGVRARSKLPSVDPEIEQAASDIVRDADAYFDRQRALYRREAEEYVAVSMRHRRSSRPSLRKFLASLVSG